MGKKADQAESGGDNQTGEIAYAETLFMPNHVVVRIQLGRVEKCIGLTREDLMLCIVAGVQEATTVIDLTPSEMEQIGGGNNDHSAGGKVMFTATREQLVEFFATLCDHSS